MRLRIGDITEFGEIRLIDWELCFVQFCEPGSEGIKAVHSRTFEELAAKKGGDSNSTS